MSDPYAYVKSAPKMAAVKAADRSLPQSQRPTPNSNRPQNNGTSCERPSPGSNARNTTLHQPTPSPRPSTWPIFLFHFALPMAFLVVVSNMSDIYDGFPSLLSPTTLSSSPSPSSKESVEPSALPTHSSSESIYRNEITAAIERRKKAATIERRKKARAKTKSGRNSESAGGKGPQSSPAYLQMEATIETLRAQYEESYGTSMEHLAAVRYADFLKYRDVTIHDGGTYQMEAIEVYSRAVDLLEEIWSDKMARGEEVRLPAELSSRGYDGLNHELFLDYESKSTEGALCAVHANLGKVYFMSNMFDRAVASYEDCLSYDYNYLDSLTNRAQSFLILGRYDEAARDYKRALDLDVDRFFPDAVSGMAKVLTAKEDAIAGGWDFLVELLETELPKMKKMHSDVKLSHEDDGRLLKHYSDGMKRMHHAMFAYADVKTKNAAEAWDHLSKGNAYKLSLVAPFDAASKKEQVSRVKAVFTSEFFPSGIGSQTRTPIFIIGFVRSGSTLLERIMDAHPAIVGTGEDSVFNGRLDAIRNEVVEASMVGDPSVLQQTVRTLADDVVADMKTRWEVIYANVHHEDEESKEKSNPVRFVDKMLTNYMNVGFLHLLFPDALILHVAREPMDCIFSAFKHDFPPGGLDYTSEFAGLAQLYHSYRDIMEHWDHVLPGRVTHIRYEDLVTDLPNIAPQVMAAAGVPWDPTVLEFHKKKHAVNTLSTSQVRKGVYSHHFKEWKRYETFLEPLSDLVGHRVEYNLKTSVSGYLKTAAIPTMETATERQIM